MVNRVDFWGRLTCAPTVRQTTSGKAVADMRCAISTRTKKDGEWADGDPVFVDVTVWGKYAEQAGAQDKGGKVVVSGRLAFDEWTDKEGGKRSKVYVMAERVMFGEQQQARADAMTPDALPARDGDDLPF